jgi:hypothetical protein
MVTTRSGDHTEADAGGAGSKHGIKHRQTRSSPAPKRTKRSAQENEDQAVAEENDSTMNESEANGSSNKANGSPKAKKQGKKLIKDEEADVNEAARADKMDEDTDVPSSILEKGIIYFFIRGRVGVEEPEGVGDVARSYMILRPIPRDSQLGHAKLKDAGNCRLLALPKKVLPRSGRDRFVAFVEKSAATLDELKDKFLAGSDYETKTMGTRHSPAADPVGEGVYALTSTGRDTHLAYILTVPAEADFGKLQKQLGLKERGSFIISTRNPKYPAPAGARLPEGPTYPREIENEFRDLRWPPTKPEHLDFVKAQFLLIGESSGLDRATEPQKEDVEEGKETPLDVLEELEDEDTKRMKHLDGDDAAAVFKDLHAFSDMYSNEKAHAM